MRKPNREAVIVKLARLDTEAYAEQRNEVAKKLEITVQELDAAVETARVALKENEPNPNKKLIRYQPGDIETASIQSENLLKDGFGLKYFERNRELVHTIYGRDEKSNDQVVRDEASLIVSVASNHTVIDDLDKLAQFWTPGKGNSKKFIRVPVALPDKLANRVATKPRDVPFPTLALVTTSPVLLPSGRPSTELFEDGVLFAPRPNLFARIPEKPSQDDGRNAILEIDKIFQQFPFVDPETDSSPSDPWKKRRMTASYSCVLASIFSLVARPYIRFGPVPLFGIKAPARRTGKSKIAKAVVAAGAGHLPTTIHFANETEFSKHLLPLMRAADRAILIDNVELILQSTKLNILVTENVMKDRILGESADLTLRNVAVFFATGNNLTIGGDLSARTVRIDLDAMMEQPEGRSFTFDPVQQALKNHPKLVVAALTALRAYIVAGKPWTKTRAPWGGFLEWDTLVSGCLMWLGFADPFAARNRVTEDDPTRSAGSDLLSLLQKRYGNKTFSFGDIQAEKSGDVYNALLKDGIWNGHHAQWVFRRIEGRPIDGIRLRRCPGRSMFRIDTLSEIGALNAPGTEPAEEDLPF